MIWDAGEAGFAGYKKDVVPGNNHRDYVLEFKEKVK